MSFSRSYTERSTGGTVLKLSNSVINIIKLRFACLLNKSILCYFWLASGSVRKKLFNVSFITFSQCMPGKNRSKFRRHKKNKKSISAI